MTKAELVESEPTVESNILSDLNAPLPEDVDACFDLMEKNLMASIRYSTLRFWAIGRIADTLETKGEKNVIARLEERTKFCDRNLRYALAVYRSFPDSRKVYTLCEKGVNWSAFKDLLKVKDAGERLKLVAGIEKETIEVESLAERIDKIKDVPKPKEEKEKTIQAPKAVKFFEKLSSHIGVTYNKTQEFFVPVPDYIDYIDDEVVCDEETYRRCAEACQETVRKLKLTRDFIDKKIEQLEGEVIAHVPTSKSTSASATKPGQVVGQAGCGGKK